MTYIAILFYSDTLPRLVTFEVQLMELTSKQLGPFLVLDNLGVDGAVLVLRAHDTRSHQDVLLYLLDASILDDVAEAQRFIEAGQVAGQVQHENLIAMPANR
jgi:hypothetical protein